MCVLLIDVAVIVARGVIMSVGAYTRLAEDASQHPLLPALEALDLFLFAVVILILAVGLAKLFLGDLPLFSGVELSWLKLDSFSALKLLLWDALLLTLVVFFVADMIAHDMELNWFSLVLPGSILMLALASFLLKQKH